MTDAREVIFRWLSFTGYTHEDDQDADVTSIHAALAEAGLVVVPREPTFKMVMATVGPIKDSLETWRAMVGAASDE